MRRRRTVRGSIFLSVSILLVCVLLASSLVVYDYVSAVARERFADALTSLSRSLMTNLEAQVAEMDRLSLTLIYSPVFQGLYARHLALPRTSRSNEEQIARITNTEAIIEIGETILGPNRSAPQVNVYDLRGGMIGAGYFSQLIETDVSARPWYAEVLRRDGERTILAPHMDSLLEQTSVIVKDKRYVSLLRTFRDPLLSTQGVVEVEQYCDTLFSEPVRLAGSSASVYVFDADGTQLYPYDGPRPEAPSILQIARRGTGSSIVTGNLPGQPSPQIFAVALSPGTGWSLVLGEPSAGLAASVLQYTVRIGLVALAAIALSLAASYFIARRVTVPLSALHGEIEALDLSNLGEMPAGVQGRALGEIDALRVAFHDMRIKLNDALQEAVALRAHEKEAELVALQAQLNPHFLHNMLQTIAIMAEESSPGPVQALILNLTRVLRYASSTEGTTATLGTEMEYAESYLAAMRARFGSSLQYSLDLPEDMREIVVPRLVLQPFLENCFKYGTTSRPPWRVDIRGCRGDGRWRVEILDNGPGFDQATLGRITGRLAARRKNGAARAPMSISGMGILNSSERMRVTFGDDALFEITNRPGGGARIALGASLHD